MKAHCFSKVQRRVLMILSIIGLIGPNGVFLYYALTDASLLMKTMKDPIAMAFIIEAFLLMVILAWTIKICGFKKPGWLAFVVMSLIGSLAFSIPAYLWLLESRNSDQAA